MEEKINNSVEEFNKSYSYNNKKTASFTHCSTCSSPLILRLFSTIEDVAIISHSPIGCSASFIDFNRKNKNELKRRNLQVKNSYLVSTNLNEKDVIYGIDLNLEKSIFDTIHKLNPIAIFVSASCGSGVSGLDIQQVIDKLRDKISIPIVTIVCEIYGPKKWGSGFNGYNHGVFKDIVKPKEQNEEFYNIINLSNDNNIKKLLDKSDISWNYISYYSDYKCFESMVNAKATFLITNDRFSKYIANWLEREYQVPNIQITNPCGFKGTDLFLKKVGEIVNKPEVFNEIILEQEEIFKEQFNLLCKRLKGVKSLPIVTGDIYLNKIINMLMEFNIEVLDINNKIVNNNSADMGEKGKSKRNKFNERKNVYELVKAIYAINPDIVIAKDTNFTACGGRIGYPSFWMDDEDVFFGYLGMIKFGNKLANSLNCKNFYKRLSSNTGLPYRNFKINNSQN